MRGLQPQLEQQGINVLLVDIHQATGTTLSERYNFEFSPTYIIFDGSGEELWRSNQLPSMDIITQYTK